ncbi:MULTISPECIES: hypothetical protein [Burkholderia]|uniref:Alkanesulfonate monooxygenase n=1 Tax=Burkholderia aenigmatica TaxID=2015348 RepID=A0ABY6Y8U7_9BURK|nr:MULTISPECIES: hypothetical protein [Burkholderia]VWD37025.1 Alkanesulfonate monooxygenase [Burkholderia aenigmatica]VWD52570.1 Alkanesulfonate monooxygenase [Burkholderia aenigmatica]
MTNEYAAHDCDAFILSGFPLIEDAHRVAHPLFPLLDPDHGFDVRALAPSPYGAADVAPQPG